MVAARVARNVADRDVSYIVDPTFSFIETADHGSVFASDLGPLPFSADRDVGQGEQVVAGRSGDPFDLDVVAALPQVEPVLVERGFSDAIDHHKSA